MTEVLPLTWWPVKNGDGFGDGDGDGDDFNDGDGVYDLFLCVPCPRCANPAWLCCSLVCLPDLVCHLGLLIQVQSMKNTHPNPCHSNVVDSERG